MFAVHAPKYVDCFHKYKNIKCIYFFLFLYNHCDRDMDKAVERLPAILENSREFAAEPEEVCLALRPTGAEIVRLPELKKAVLARQLKFVRLLN